MTERLRRSFQPPETNLGPWSVEVELGVVSGQVGCVGLTITPLSDPPTEPLTTAVLRAIPLGTLVARARDDSEDELLDLVGLKLPQRLGALQEAGLGPLAADHPRRRGPKPRGPEFYGEVARVYASATHSPTQLVAKHFEINPSTAASWVRQARHYGLLKPTSKGRRSGA